VDLTLLTGFGGEEPFIERLLQQYAEESTIRQSSRESTAFCLYGLRPGSVSTLHWGLFPSRSPSSLAPACFPFPDRCVCELVPPRT
jgi:hypothetical protein